MQRIAFHHMIYMVVPVALLSGLGEFIPNLEPHAILLVNLLTADLNRHLANECMAQRVRPCDVVRDNNGSGRVDAIYGPIIPSLSGYLSFI